MRCSIAILSILLPIPSPSTSSEGSSIAHRAVLPAPIPYPVNWLSENTLYTRGWHMTRQSGRSASSFVAPTEKLSESHIHSFDFRGERSQLCALLGTILLTIPLADRDNKRSSQYGSEAVLLNHTSLPSLTAPRASVQLWTSGCSEP
jgi:hypothetical protein